MAKELADAEARAALIRTRVDRLREMAPEANLSSLWADWWRDAVTAEAVREPLLRAAAWYYLHARTAGGTPLDSVARFHLGNGARLERLDWLADTSPKALGQSYGLMVNYL